MKHGDPLSGKPICVVFAEDVGGKTRYKLNEEALHRLLLNQQVSGLKVCIVSIAGIFRGGKSFILNFLLRYLDAKDSANWIGSNDSPLVGFPWRNGSQRETTGIVMWSKPFVRLLPNGERVAVLLMDTQGSFDSDSTTFDSATIFTLSTMLSSVQIYNVSRNFQEDYLQYLQFYVQYGRLALKRGCVTPFQNLHFLIRDWFCPYEYEYGDKGGQKLLDDKLISQPGQKKELQDIREWIGKCFQNIKCFLMPHPGLKVTTNKNFDGRLADMEPLFVENLKRFVSLILHESNLMPKKINGEYITCRDLIDYFRSYVEVFQSNDLPEPRSFLQATLEVPIEIATKGAMQHFNNKVEDKFGENRPYMEPESLKKTFEQINKESLKFFDDKTRDVCGDDFCKKCRDLLVEHISLTYRTIYENNEKKYKGWCSYVQPTLNVLNIGSGLANVASFGWYLIAGMFYTPTPQNAAVAVASAALSRAQRFFFKKVEIKLMRPSSFDDLVAEISLIIW